MIVLPSSSMSWLSRGAGDAGRVAYNLSQGLVDAAA